jgi:DNA topoisomerase-2
MENRKYKILSEIDHILQRPGMYIGSVVTEKSTQYVLENGKFVQKEVEYNPGFLKLFDEIISNSVDESKRTGTKLNTIKVDIDKYEGTISVFDNGGIPVKLMEGTKEYIPAVCFSRLRAGSNFDDTEKRTWVGTNGIGSVVSNIFSTLFEVETADGEKKFSMYWNDNMKKHSMAQIKNTIQHYTRITYTPELSRFGMDKIGDDVLKLIEKRVYEIAGCNPNLNIFYNGKKIQINSFQDYCKMYIEDDGLLLYEENKDWQVGVSVSPTGSFQQVSYVNCVYTYDGGTHLEYILNRITPFLREKIGKKYKTDILPGQIKNHIFLFINSTVFNPQFSSQTKEKLITDIKNFGTEIKLTDKFLNQIYKSEITNSITDWLDQKKLADEKKAEREVNKSLSKIKVDKLVDCKFAGTSKKHLTSLSITEGDSASAGFRRFRNPETQALISIKGKILNTRDASKEKIRENKEIQGIMSAMGLKFGQSPFVYRNGKLFEDNLRIHTVNILTDADTDGSNISALLVNIFACYWPELFKEHRIAKIDTPILIVKQGKKEIKFYYKSDYDEWCEKNDVTKWNVEYYKGLSALEDKDYKDIIQNPNIYYYELDDIAQDELDIWFGGDSGKRKEKLRQ